MGQNLAVGRITLDVRKFVAPEIPATALFEVASTSPTVSRLTLSLASITFSSSRKLSARLKSLAWRAA